MTMPADASRGAAVRVCVIDARRLVREGVAVLIGDEPDLRVCAVLAGISSDAEFDEAAAADVIVLGRGGAADGLSGRIVNLLDDQHISTLLTALRGTAHVVTVNTATTAATEGAAVSLTARELTVLRAVGAGQSAPQIAAVLGLSPRTVEGYKQTVLAKLAVQSQAQAIARSRELGLL